MSSENQHKRDLEQITFRLTADLMPEPLADFIYGGIGQFISNTEGVWLAGGALRRIFSGEPYYLEEHDMATDFDIFFRDETSLKQCIDLMDERTTRTSTHDWVFTYHTNNGEKVQLIKKKFYSSPYDLMDDFDMTACQIVLECNILYSYTLSIRDMQDKIMKPVKLDNFRTCLKHVVRYGLYGYELSEEMIIALSMAAKGHDTEKSNSRWLGSDY